MENLEGKLVVLECGIKGKVISNSEYERREKEEIERNYYWDNFQQMYSGLPLPSKPIVPRIAEGSLAVELENQDLFVVVREDFILKDNTLVYSPLTGHSS